MHYSTICFKNQTMFTLVKIDCYYRVTTDSILGYIEIEMKKALKPLRIKAFYMVGVTGFEPMASWSRNSRIVSIYRILPTRVQYIVYRHFHMAMKM